MSDDQSDTPGWAAQMDQALCGARDQAKLVAAFWLALVADGVEPQAATYLAATFITGQAGD